MEVDGVVWLTLDERNPFIFQGGAKVLKRLVKKPRE
jgi:hypothetical protein